MRCLANPEVTYQTVHQAVSMGINHLETARGYGQSETYLGLAIQRELPIERSQLYITTKLPPTPDRALMAQWIDESLERLQLDYIDCLGIHGINTQAHLDWVKDGCYPAIADPQSKGFLSPTQGFPARSSRRRDLGKFLFAPANIVHGSRACRVSESLTRLS